MKRIKEYLLAIRNLIEWLYPFTLFLLILLIIKYFLLKDLSFNDFVNLLKILVWPVTILIILFFFKEVVTYLFFSMDGFNFFGARGTLRNVNEIIVEGVNKKFLEEKKEKDRGIAMFKLNSEISNKEKELSVAIGTVEDYKKIAKEIINDWRESTNKNKKIIEDLEKENKRLKDIISSLPIIENTGTEESSLLTCDDDKKTSDPILDQSSIK